MTHWMRRKQEPIRLVDPNAPVFGALERITANMTPHERAVWMIDFMDAVVKRQEKSKAAAKKAAKSNKSKE